MLPHNYSLLTLERNLGGKCKELEISGFSFVTTVVRNELWLKILYINVIHLHTVFIAVSSCMGANSYVWFNRSRAVYVLLGSLAPVELNEALLNGLGQNKI